MYNLQLLKLRSFDINDNQRLYMIKITIIFVIKLNFDQLVRNKRCGKTYFTTF